MPPPWGRDLPKLALVHSTWHEPVRDILAQRVYLGTGKQANDLLRSGVLRLTNRPVREVVHMNGKGNKVSDPSSVARRDRADTDTAS